MNSAYAPEPAPPTETSVDKNDVHANFPTSQENRPGNLSVTLKAIEGADVAAFVGASATQGMLAATESEIREASDEAA